MEIENKQKTYLKIRRSNLLLILSFIILSCCNQPKHMSPVSEASDKICYDFVKSVQQIYPQLYPSGIGGGVDKGKVTEIHIVFKTDGFLDIESARGTFTDIASLFEKLITENPDYFQYFDEDQPISNYLCCNILAPENPKSKYFPIVEVSLDKNLLEYLTAKDSYSPLISVHEETLDEARAIVNKSKKNASAITSGSSLAP